MLSSGTSASTPAHHEPFFFYYCYLLLIISISIFPAAATDHIVGANKGWNSGINYTLWANNNTFYVGDLISFRYQKTQYNVFEVNQTGYDNCTTEGATGNWSSGKDFIPLNKPKRYFFICGNGGCFSGMKVSVLVHPLPPPPSSASPTNLSFPSSAAAPLLRHGLGSSAFKITTLLLIWVCSGWI
ncbi:early nodulin-like protein 19 [Malania oleifera]|uniref:early nodulin-like protein 19 n=1 Tax=Malania oleifera TaxID=397392 RepID=UPI0025ADF194|nr:early nodulin-like protein 19 [Malania oleifera]